MPTGTSGPDNLRIDQDNPDDTAFGLAGDDIITVSAWVASNGGYSEILVDGGEGHDIFRTEDIVWMRGTGIAGQIVYTAPIENGGTITYSSFERVELTAHRWFGQSELITGDSSDRIEITNGVISGGNPVWLTLRGGDDEVLFFGNCYNARIDLGSGDDSLVFGGTPLTAGLLIEARGGDGNDDMNASAGASMVILYGDAGDDVLRSGSGHDRLEGGVGADFLHAGHGNDILDGGTGIDQMTGGTGNDRFFVEAGDILIERAGEGIDIAYARTDYGLNAGAHVDLLTAIDASSAVAIHLTGNELGNTIQGNAAGNRLLGEGGDDYLVGLGGLDVLDGGQGIDTLDGGTGNDRYFVDLGDRVLERAGEGVDIVYARTDYVLNAGAHVDLLAAVSALATDGIDLTGNELGNTIQGDSGANSLTGAGGADHLTGFGGADTFRFVALSDSAHGAADRIADFASGSDRIDLSLIDANSSTPDVDDGFTYIGANAFSGTAGELRVELVGSLYHLTGDVNGDRIADLHITVNGAVAAADFLF